MSILKAACALLVLMLLGPAVLLAEEADSRPARALQDNSFLVEEAYN